MAATDTLVEEPLVQEAPPRRRHPWLRATAIVLLLLFIGEAAARYGLTKYDAWYGPTAMGPVDFVFIGSSRVASAIDPGTFEEVMSEKLGRPVRVVNLGRGDSTAAEHYFGLRKLDASMKARQRDYVLFVETPGGLPDGFMQGTWDEPWVRPNAQGLIARVLRPTDAPRILRSKMSVGTKLHLAFRALASNSTLISYREQWRDFTIDRVERLATKVLHPFAQKGVGEGSPTNLRGGAGGIRNDPAGIARARKLAEDARANGPGEQQPLPDWNGQIIDDIVRRHTAAGGTTVFYDIPLSSYFRPSYETKVRAEDRARFTEQERSWGALQLHPDVDFPDSAFPDLWHLGIDAAPTFTRSLAEAWIASGAPEPTGTSSR